MAFCKGTTDPKSRETTNFSLFKFRVREIHLSLAGHFVRQTASPLPGILTSHWTFHFTVKCPRISNFLLNILNSSPDIQLSLIYSPWTFCPARSNPFARHFSKIARHVRQVRQILCTLFKLGRVLPNGT